MNHDPDKLVEAGGKIEGATETENAAKRCNFTARLSDASQSD